MQPSHKCKKHKHKGILLEEVLKLIVYSIILVGLIFLGVRLYNMLTESSEEMQARTTLENLKDAIEKAKEQGESTLLIYAPKDWKIIFFPKNLKEIEGIKKPSLVFDESVICITKGKECRKFYFTVGEDLMGAKIEIKEVQELVFKFRKNQYSFFINLFDVSYDYFMEQELELSDVVTPQPETCEILEVNFPCKENKDSCDVRIVFKDYKFKHILFSNNDNGADGKDTEFVNPALKDIIINFDERLEDINKKRGKEEKIKVYITDGYSDEDDHISSCHNIVGTCIDIVVLLYDESSKKYREAKDEDWEEVKRIVNDLCFLVLDERKKIYKHSTGPHFHLDRCNKYYGFCSLGFDLEETRKK